MAVVSKGNGAGHKTLKLLQPTADLHVERLLKPTRWNGLVQSKIRRTNNQDKKKRAYSDASWTEIINMFLKKFNYFFSCFENLLGSDDFTGEFLIINEV